jgi:hypothetical protein
VSPRGFKSWWRLIFGGGGEQLLGMVVVPAPQAQALGQGTGDRCAKNIRRSEPGGGGGAAAEDGGGGQLNRHGQWHRRQVCRAPKGAGPWRWW